MCALARDPSKIDAPSGADIIVGDLNDADTLKRLAADTDYFFHLAGVTHPRHDSDYDAVNVTGTACAASAASHAGAKFVYVSSLAAREPQLSPYARSKRDGEIATAKICAPSKWLTLRLPAIYGPGDRATLPYFKLINAGFALEPKTNSPAKASLLFVEDAARAVVAGALKAETGKIYEVGDDAVQGREWSEIGRTLGDALGNPVKRVRVPRLAITIYHRMLRGSARLSGSAPSVRTGQINEFFHSDWVASEKLLSDAIPWNPETSLKEGFAKTVHWYQEHRLL